MLIVIFFGILFLSMLSTALLELGRFQFTDFCHERKQKFLFFSFFRKFFPENSYENMQLNVSLTKQILLILFGSLSIVFLTFNSPFSSTLFKNFSKDLVSHYIVFIALMIALILFFDFIGRFFALKYTHISLKIAIFFSSLYLFVFFPVTYIFLKLLAIFQINSKDDEESESIQTHLKGMMLETELKDSLDKNEKKILESFITFNDKAAREIMIPRVDVFALPAKTTMIDAVKSFSNEDYSRIPIYKDKLDNIIGVLMYKDLLKQFAKEDPSILLQPIESIVKPVIFSPENKNISKLFNDFKNKKTHLSIIVNEYGGMEGIVTIEDILEELVGEIQDEYDTEAMEQYVSLPNKEGYVVDAKMSIIDLENQLDIHIPHNPEYETIGGYIFHRAGTIPAKGWKLHIEELEIEVIKSDERKIEKVKIILHKKS